MSTFLTDSVFFGVAISLVGYGLGMFISKKFKNPIFNPILIAVIFIISVLLLCNVEYEQYNRNTNFINFLLTPATVCLAIPLYKQIDLLKTNVKAILLGVSAGVLASLGSIFALSKLFGLGRIEYLTLLPKSITTAIGIGISEELGGMVTITVATIIMTGMLGNILGETVCKIFRIKHPIARGLAIGTAAHAVGTARAMEMGKVEGAMSSLAIVIAGLLTVVGASVFAGFM